MSNLSDIGHQIWSPGWSKNTIAKKKKTTEFLSHNELKLTKSREGKICNFSFLSTIPARSHEQLCVATMPYKQVRTKRQAEDKQSDTSVIFELDGLH